MCPLSQDQVPSGETAMVLPPPSVARRWWVTALLLQRCPRCREGKIFRGVVTMNDPCPVCGLIFQREEGYFLGAMYCSYVLGVAILTPTFFLLSALLPDWNGILVALLALVPYLPLTPFVFRYSRVLWIYLDRVSDPTDLSAGAYEKHRMKQLAEQKRTPPGPP